MSLITPLSVIFGLGGFCPYADATAQDADATLRDADATIRWTGTRLTLMRGRTPLETGTAATPFWTRLREATEPSADTLANATLREYRT